MQSEIATATNISDRLTIEIFPKSASKISSSVESNAPAAKARVKTTPTKVSTGSFVLCSTVQIISVPNTRNMKAPKNGLKWKMSPSAMPGSATCESASPTSAMRRKSAKEPIIPPAAAIAPPANNAYIKLVVSMCFVNMMIKFLFPAVQFFQFERCQHFRRRPETNLIFIQTKNFSDIFVDDRKIMRNENYSKTLLILKLV